MFLAHYIITKQFLQIPPKKDNSTEFQQQVSSHAVSR